MIDPKELTDEELIRREFMRRFSMWDLPTEKLDERLRSTPNEKRQEHYLGVTDFVNSQAFNDEIAEWKRRVIHTLAIGEKDGVVLSETAKAGLKIFLCEIDNWVGILKMRSTFLQSHRPLVSPSRSI